jgi:hypothetical protein
VTPRHGLTGRRGLTALLAVLAVLLTGCATLPVSGPVRTGPSMAATDEAPYDFNPAGPRPQESPLAVVGGFLLAMQATPQSTSVAREFLTPESRARWSPDNGTVIYGTYGLTSSGRAVTVHLTGTARLDARGRWLGETSQGGRLAFHLRLAKVHGQWRIDNPPDVLVIPQTHFEARFQQFNLYYFDESGQVLVPEPVYLPVGDQAPTLLVKGLLQGPAKDEESAVRSFIPARTRLDDLSVPVSRQGVATVSLSAPMLTLGTDERQLALAQLGWTLAQVSGIDRMRIQVNGSPLDVPGQGVEPSVDAWSEYDPAVSWASHELFGLRAGHVVTLLGGTEHRVPQVFPSGAPAVRSIAVDLTAQQVAGVTEDGGSVLLGRIRQPAGGVSAPAATPPVYSEGTDLLKPAWDLYGQLWLVDRTDAGAVITVLRDGRPTQVQAPGISGHDVTAFALSRDGTRLVAVLAGSTAGAADRMVVTQVRRDRTGRVVSLGPAEEVPVTSGQVGHIRDLAWFSPTTVAVLVSTERGLCQVFLSRVDGSSGFVESATSAGLFRGRASRVITAASPGAPLYLETPARRLFALDASGRWSDAGIKPGLVSPTFVG